MAERDGIPRHGAGGVVTALIRTDATVVDHRCTDAGPVVRFKFPRHPDVADGATLVCAGCATVYEYRKPRAHPTGADPHRGEQHVR